MQLTDVGVNFVGEQAGMAGDGGSDIGHGSDHLDDWLGLFDGDVNNLLRGRFSDGNLGGLPRLCDGFLNLSRAVQSRNTQNRER